MRLGSQELLIILLLVLIVFGAGKLPQVLRSMGQGVRAFKDEVGSKEEPEGGAPTAQR
ncbi:MAG TPA: twin-arginine translocase TatA/TatE family subunit [bacterium]|nr:twin-arginine translocase TatA/TatE family subunit [bacterium]